MMVMVLTLAEISIFFRECFLEVDRGGGRTSGLVAIAWWLTLFYLYRNDWSRRAAAKRSRSRTI
jgi:hypothetical protein